MKKSELAKALTKHNDLTLKRAKEILNLFFAEMAEALAEGEGVKMSGFGSLSVREYDSYTGCHPRTGKKFEVMKPKRLPFFKPGRILLGRLNGSPEQEGQKKGE